MKNRYGGPLRKFIAAKFSLRFYIDLVDTPAFHSDVMAYPAIIVMHRREEDRPQPTRLAHRPAVDREALARLRDILLLPSLPAHDGVYTVEGVARGPEPWILASLDQRAVLHRL